MSGSSTGVTKPLEILKVCWQCPAMFCLYTSSKLSRSYFEFSLKVKVMGSSAGYLLDFFFYFNSRIFLKIVWINSATSSSTIEVTVKSLRIEPSPEKVAPSYFECKFSRPQNYSLWREEKRHKLYCKLTRYLSIY